MGSDCNYRIVQAKNFPDNKKKDEFRTLEYSIHRI